MLTVIYIVEHNASVNSSPAVATIERKKTMKATVNGITYEGTEEEIRRIVENPPPMHATCASYGSEYSHDDALESKFALLR